MGVPEGARWSSEVNVVSMAKGIIAEAATSVSARSRGPAKAPTVGLLAKLERIVCQSLGAPDTRMLSWWMLVSSWASLRFDDHRGLSPEEVTETKDGLDMLLSRTKTTGADKAVHRRACVVGREAWVAEPNWLSAGWELWQSQAPRGRDYLLTQYGPDSAIVYREMSYTEYAGRMRGILSGLSDEEGGTLGSDAAVFWRPHSWRAFLPSMAVALGAPSDSLKWLSAWRAQSADAYVRTSRVKAIQIQTTVARLLRLHMGGGDPVGEQQALEELGYHLAERGIERAEWSGH